MNQLSYAGDVLATSFIPMLGLDDEETFVMVVITVATLIALGLVIGNLRRYLQTRAREMTRREVAAYVAEGSISPDDARVLLGKGDSSEAEQKIADAVSWGMLKAEKAEALIRALRDEYETGKKDKNQNQESSA